MADIEHPPEADEAELALLDRKLREAEKALDDDELPVIPAGEDDEEQRYHESGGHGQDDQTIAPPG